MNVGSLFIGYYSLFDFAIIKITLLQWCCCLIICSKIKKKYIYRTYDQRISTNFPKFLIANVQIYRISLIIFIEYKHIKRIWIVQIQISAIPGSNTINFTNSLVDSPIEFDSIFQKCFDVITILNLGNYH